MKPTIGRIVHYYPLDHQDGQEPFAAIITRLTGSEGIVFLYVMPPTSEPFTAIGSARSDDPTPGCWTWPPRV